MALHIALAFDGPGPSAGVTCLYAGRDADAARKAAAASGPEHYRFEFISNPGVIRKANDRYAAPAPIPAPVPVEEPPAPRAKKPAKPEPEPATA